MREFRLGRVELAILSFLAEAGEASVAEIARRICGEGWSCYASVWRSLQSLKRKGFVEYEAGTARLKTLEIPLKCQNQ